MQEYFKSKKIMIIVPHQDDEFNIVGGLLANEYFNPTNVKIVYTTNGDYLCNYKARYREVFKISRKTKIPRENFIFMGYADQHIKESEHIYMTHEPNVFLSKKGNTETFAAYIGEYHYTKYNEHAKFNYENFYKDMKEIIIENIPDVIFSIDLDSHPDHRAASLTFDKVIGEILKQNLNYNPLIYKAFAYPTAYKGINDFNDINLLPTKFNIEKNSLSEFQNPYYDWQERISFPTNMDKLLIRNRLYKLLKIYRSQLFIKHTKQIINSDVVFWQKRTDNLARNAEIQVSSGNASVLNDLITIELEKITNGDKIIPNIKNIAWIPDENDKDKEITIKFPKTIELSEMKLYQNVVDDSNIKSIQITLDKENQKFHLKQNKEIIEFDNLKVNEIKVKVLDSKGKNAGFSEIEIFSKNKLFDSIIVEINGNVISDKIFLNRLEQIKCIKFYCYNGFEKYEISQENILINNQKAQLRNIKFGLNKISLNNNLSISKNINIIKISKYIKIKNKIINLMNDLTIKQDIFISKIYNKIDRLTKRL